VTRFKGKMSFKTLIRLYIHFRG